MTRTEEPGDGARVDRTVTPVTRHVVDVEAGRVRRIEVRDDQSREFPVFVSPTPAPLVFVEPGRRYRLVGLLWSGPPTVEYDPRPCLACGGPLRPGRRRGRPGRRAGGAAAGCHRPVRHRRRPDDRRAPGGAPERVNNRHAAGAAGRLRRVWLSREVRRPYCGTRSSYGWTRTNPSVPVNSSW